MGYLPLHSILGNLQILEIYEYYDQPCLFSCKSRAGQIFLAVWIDSIESGDVWLYAPVSSERFQELRNGIVDIRSIFRYSEDAFVFRVVIPNIALPAKVTNVACNELDEEDLPEGGQMLEIQTEAENRNNNIELPGGNIHQIAIEKRREISNFIFELPDVASQEAPIGDLGEILTTLQNTIHAFGQVKEGRPSGNTVSPDTIQKTKLVTSKVFSGSFGIQIEGAFFEEKLFGDSLIGECIEELILLLNIGSNREGLNARLSVLKRNAVFKYKAFLIALRNSGIRKLHIDWASPVSGRSRIGEISFTTIEEVIDVIENTRLESETPIVVLVKVVMIHYKTQKITLRNIRVKENYKCRIADGALEDVETISKKTTYIASIKDFLMLSPIIEKEIHEYELQSLKVYDESAEQISLLPVSG